MSTNHAVLPVETVDAAPPNPNTDGMAPVVDVPGNFQPMSMVASTATHDIEGGTRKPKIKPMLVRQCVGLLVVLTAYIMLFAAMGARRTASGTSLEWKQNSAMAWIQHDPTRYTACIFCLLTLPAMVAQHAWSREQPHCHCSRQAGAVRCVAYCALLSALAWSLQGASWRPSDWFARHKRFELPLHWERYTLPVKGTMRTFWVFRNRAWQLRNSAHVKNAAHIFVEGSSVTNDMYPHICENVLARDDMLFVAPQSLASRDWYLARDAPFIIELVALLKREFHVDGTQLLLSGHSMGAWLVEGLVCAQPFPILAAISYSNPWPGAAAVAHACKGHIPMLLVHGALDVQGGNTLYWNMRGYIQSFRNWERVNGCNGTVVLKDLRKTVYIARDCTARAQMAVLDGQRHVIAQPQLCRIVQPWIDQLYASGSLQGSHS